MSKPTRPLIPTKNRLLSALPGAEYNQLLPYLELVELSQSTILQDQNEIIQYVYFPINAVVSLLSITEKDENVEVGLVGREGMIGVSVAMGVEKSPCRTMVQVSGNGMRLNASTLSRELKRIDILNKLLLKYIHLLLAQSFRSSACKNFHSVESQLCYFLLETDDRIKTGVIPYT